MQDAIEASGSGAPDTIVGSGGLVTELRLVSLRVASLEDVPWLAELGSAGLLIPYGPPWRGQSVERGARGEDHSIFTVRIQAKIRLGFGKPPCGSYSGRDAGAIAMCK